MNKCEKLNNCPFFKKFPEYATSYMYVYCEGPKMESCARILYAKNKGVKPPDNLAPTGSLVLEPSTEDILVEKTELLNASLELSGDGAWSWDIQEKFLHFNSACFSMIGYEPNEFQATYKNFVSRVHDDDKHIVINAAKKHFSGALPNYSVEFRFLRKDGGYAWLQSRGKIVKYDANGKPLRMVGVQSNITTRKELEHVAFRNVQLASVGQLAASVAHEINNPVNGIINYAQLLQNCYEPDGKAGGLVLRIKKEAIRIENIVREMLVTTNNPSNKKGFHSIKDIVVSALSVLDVSYRKEGVSVLFKWSESLPLIHCNYQQVEQIVINVLRNAYQAFSSDQSEDKKIIISGEVVQVLNEPHLQLKIANNGPTIPPEVLENIMKPFFTTKPDKEGTGLGLCISSNIMKEHGGELVAHSAPGELTEMVLSFPVNTKSSEGESLTVMPERRSSVRVKAEIKASFGVYANELLTGYSIDLSSNGAFIATTCPFVIDDNVILHLFVPGQEEEAVSCTARVAWVNRETMPTKPSFPAGVGLQFVDLKPEDLDSLVDFIKKEVKN